MTTPSPAHTARARVTRTPGSGLGADPSSPAPLRLPLPPPPSPPPPPRSPGGVMGEACRASCPQAAPVALPPTRCRRLVLRGGGTGSTPAPSSSLPAPLAGVSSGSTPCAGQGAQGGTRSPCPHTTAAQVQRAPVGSCSRRPHRLQPPLPPRCRHGPGPTDMGGVAQGETQPPVLRRHPDWWLPVPCVGGPVASSPCQGLHSGSASVEPAHGPAACVPRTLRPSPLYLQASFKLPASSCRDRDG